MTYKQVKNHVEKLGGRFYIIELLVILLLCSFFLKESSNFSNISLTKFVLNNESDSIGPLDSRSVMLIRRSFLIKNLAIDWDYYGCMLTCKNKKAIWPDGDIYSVPVFLSPAERKPYYLFNININYSAYPLRLFRNFTKGDGTLKFVEDHKEIIALVFYKKDSAKVMKIKRKIERIVLEKKSGKGKPWGILFFED